MMKRTVILVIFFLLLASAAWSQSVRIGVTPPSGSGGGGGGGASATVLSAKLVIALPLYNDIGGEVTSGTTTMSIFRIRSDGTLDTFDFNDNTFKTSAVTTATANMTHRQGNNNTLNSGTWTYSLATVTAFANGDPCFVRVNNSSAYPATIKFFFTYSS